MKKAIFFDLDDTLLDDKRSVNESLYATCREIGYHYNTEAEAIEATVRSTAPSLYKEYPFYETTLTIGINPFEGLWGTFTDVHDKRFQVMAQSIGEYQRRVWEETLRKHSISEDSGKYWAERFRFHRQHLAFVYPETFDILRTLEKQYKLLIITNGAPSLQNEKLTMTPQLPSYFENILISGAFGVGKPDASLFHHALYLSGLRADEVIMVGDNLHTDILGAQRTNIDSIWLNHHKAETPADRYPTKTIQHLRELPEVIHKL
ncbi:HAD family hydrolase [Salsuginibacillus kocurii]|uniref:HAD family hydrolase n=1 Tax=Salsuginibacillus kocurii TaxID=427078 RepID=UPI0003742FE2|nr:HAD family hydrolase [Salsuginibacillus kocurii]